MANESYTENLFMWAYQSNAGMFWQYLPAEGLHPAPLLDLTASRQGKKDANCNCSSAPSVYSLLN